MSRDDANAYEGDGLEADHLRRIEQAMLGRVKADSRRITERVRKAADAKRVQYVVGGTAECRKIGPDDPTEEMPALK